MLPVETSKGMGYNGANMIDPSSRYGMMRVEEADLIDRLLETIATKFGVIKFLEVGVMGAGTVRGVYRRGKEIDCPVQAVGVDFEHYRPNPTPDASYVFYGKDSMDAWRDFPKDYEANFLFIDGCHCVNHAMCDFGNYSPFVENCGYTLLHDTALPTALGKTEQEPWPQADHSYAGKPPSVLGVREALKKLGLLQGYRTDWKLIEEVPSDTGLMGLCLFQKMADL